MEMDKRIPLELRNRTPSDVQARRLGLHPQTPTEKSRAKMEGPLRDPLDDSHRTQSGRHRGLGALLPRKTCQPICSPRGLQGRHLEGIPTPFKSIQAPHPMRPFLLTCLLLTLNCLSADGTFPTSNINPPPDDSHKSSPAKPPPGPPTAQTYTPVPTTQALESSRADPIPPPPATTPTREILLQMLNSSYYLLNATNPNATHSCWLCYGVAPPYYEGIAVQGTFSLVDYTECRWLSNVSLTLSQVIGIGTCVGQVPLTYTSLCNTILPLNVTGRGQFLLPHNGTWWACTTGLTACVDREVLQRTSGFCVIIRLLPRITYHTHEDFLTLYTSLKGPRTTSLTRLRREPITTETLSLLIGTRIAPGIGTGATALARQDQHYSQLRASLDSDLRFEESITHLQDSLSSLAELALQNRRKLDLLFLQQGGLCAALREECCFYRDHSGLIKDNMAKIREGLEQRRLEREARQGWFESWYNQSPWLTTLISTLLGTLIFLFLILTFGACLLNRLVQSIKDRLGTIQLMVQRQQVYMPLSTIPPDTCELADQNP